MRNAGIDKILLYCIKEFDRFCKSYLLEARRLSDSGKKEERVVAESKGDLIGRLWLRQPLLMDRLSVPRIFALLYQSRKEIPLGCLLERFGTLQTIAPSTVSKENLWLNYSTVTGALNFMRVSAPRGDSNELIDRRSEGKTRLMWRVAVIALRKLFALLLKKNNISYTNRRLAQSEDIRSTESIFTGMGLTMNPGP
ncbi:uncharacterized protein N7518_007693 [Penicillium psychrosexuale]|uniref:uncharacterized protein n=1 Tax=Penicillium psychrosexuale TaxID=1002107 RepID=UPI0025455AA6|nr:uncharacterized protein N7518_007693 [Penicillium psychrosexuale]KAJ5790682.1 hypothetical protein N7518_007693 [Penicillium psychrosexuale]